MLTAALLAAAQPLNDNSFLTHLATGRLILDRGAVPSVDPYSFTASGEPWVVQSWLVSVLFAWAERVGGLDAVRVLVMAVTGAVALLAWRLLRPADGVVARLALAAVFLTVGVGTWAERPLMFGLLAFSTYVLAGEGGLDPRWLLPVGWLWVNSHGSFPLGLVYLTAVVVGEHMDGTRLPPARRSLRWAFAGTLAGAFGPLGLGALTFPVEVLGRQDVLQHVLEWQAPAFTSLSERAFLMQGVVAVVLLVRRPSYRTGLVLAVFMGAALLGSRNIAVASIALLPSMAASVSGLGSLRSRTRPGLGRPLLAVLMLAAAILVVLRLDSAPSRLSAYPVDALGYLEGVGIDTREVRLAAPEAVGNLVTYVYGAERRVFYDDRFDMYPSEVSEAQLALAKAYPSVLTDLGRYEVDLILVRRSQSMALVLTAEPDWRTLFTDERWLLSCRRGAVLSRALRC